MSDSYYEFRQRVSRIYDKSATNSDLSKPLRYSIDRDGYTVIRSAPRRRAFPWTGLMMVFAAFFGMKGVLIATFGHVQYHDTVSSMAPDTVLEKAGVWSLYPDPVSRWVAQQIEFFR